MEPLDVDQSQRHAALADQVGLEALLRTQPVGARTGRLELARHREAREDVPAGAAADHHDGTAHDVTSRDRLSSRPIAIRLTTRSVLP